MYKIKQIPEDFIVKEISNIIVKENGRYLYFKLTKKDYNTIDAISKIAKSLGIKEKQIGFAGSKDKNAVTEQIISFCIINRDKIERLKIDDLKLEFVGYGDEPITLGDLEGNKFEITIRNLEEERVIEKEFIVNYFDEQRFSKNNVSIGRHLIKKEFKEAVDLIDDERCKKYLTTKKNDYIGGLQRIPARLLRMYANAYQSFLWNESVKRYLENNFNVIKRVKYSEGEFVFVDSESDLEIPLIGWGSENLGNEEVKEIITEVMSKERISCNDFIIKQIPEISMEGESRKAFVKIADMKISKEMKDELNPEKKKIRISFSLPKGSYATIVVKLLLG